MVSETGLPQESGVMATEHMTFSRGTDIQEFYRNCNLFVTGGTGFIGKVLIEKLLRSCPAINKIYVIIRPKRSKSPEERKEELIKCSVSVIFYFTTLKVRQKGTRPLLIFDEKINIAVPMNIGGTKEIIDLGRACVDLKASLSH
uniref:Fatty acyl-CoA reductase n=1 Tax=Timema poppense TaxID=170557 RepID=A0A7R9CPQ4_TIMPO|nr:unnamed protein product [Timema poppensis]